MIARRLLTALALLILGLGLVAACGKKGDPEAPGGSTAGYGKPYPNPKTINQ
jgi:hypothetical protein